jgi:hypothetical protein
MFFAFINLIGCVKEETTTQNFATDELRNSKDEYMVGSLLGKPFLVRQSKFPNDGWYPTNGVISAANDEGKPLYANVFSVFNLSKNKAVIPGNCSITAPSVDFSFLPHVIAASDYYANYDFKQLFTVGKKKIAFGTSFSRVSFEQLQDGFSIDFISTEYGDAINERFVSSRFGKQDEKSSFEIISVTVHSSYEITVNYKINCKMYNEKGKYLGDLVNGEVRVKHTKGQLSW